MDTIECVQLQAIVVDSRIRTDLGDIDGLSNSIKQYGLIQPIVLGRVDGEIRLIAGGRRLTALKRLGIKVLTHVTPSARGEFIWDFEQQTSEDAKLRFRALELEENLRRKQLDWREELLGKQALLAMMQDIYGKAKGGGPTSSTSSKPGFGVNKLASMLGESPATTSQDLKVAALLTQVPGLRSCKTKSEVLTKMAIATTVAGMQHVSKNTTQPTGLHSTRLWTLHEEDFRVGAAKLANESVDLVWTDLPYGAEIGAMSGQSASTLAGFDDSYDTARGILEDVAKQTFRVLKPDRYAVFCFGFVLYEQLVKSLQMAGLGVNLVPVVWVKNTKSGENPRSRYCNSYEPLLVAYKGSPVFIRPGQTNVVTIPAVSDKLQSVQKPVDLVRRFLFDMVAPGATVVDWCAGTGTTGVACHAHGCHSVLFERDPSMALIARTRLEALK